MAENLTLLLARPLFSPLLQLFVQLLLLPLTMQGAWAGCSSSVLAMQGAWAE